MAVSFAKPSAGRSFSKGGARGGVGITFDGLEEAAEALQAVNDTVIFLDRLRPRVVSDSPYYRYVTEGTRPHPIEPLRAKVLAWPGPGGTIFARRVMHPGTRANPFHERAWEAYRVEFDTRLENAMERAASGRDATASQREVQLAYNAFLRPVKAAAPVRSGALRDSMYLLLEGAAAA